MSTANKIWFLIIYAVLFLMALTMVVNEVSAEELTVEAQIIRSAKQHGIDPSLALAIAQVESSLNPNAVGSLGEIGVYQLRPEYHRVVKGNTRHNINVAMQYLAELKLRCREYGDAFFVCFNYGTARKLKYPQRFPYYLKVKAAENRRVATRTVAAAE